MWNNLRSQYIWQTNLICEENLVDMYSKVSMGLFHHHKVQAIYHAVNTFKKYHSKLKIGQLFKFKAYHNLHIIKVSLYDKLNKALHQYGNQMNHQIFL